MADGEAQAPKIKKEEEEEKLKARRRPEELRCRSCFRLKQQLQRIIKSDDELNRSFQQLDDKDKHAFLLKCAVMVDDDLDAEKKAKKKRDEAAWALSRAQTDIARAQRMGGLPVEGEWSLRQVEAQRARH